METTYEAKPDMEFVTGVGYVEKQPWPRVFVSQQGPRGAYGNQPYRRPEAKPMSKKGARHARRFAR